MKYLLFTILVTVSAICTAQSKKETIELLQSKLDSLTKVTEAVKAELGKQTESYDQLNTEYKNTRSSLSEKEQLIKKLNSPGRISSGLFKKYSRELELTKSDSSVQKITSIQHIDPFTVNVYTNNEKDFFLAPDESWEMCDQIHYVYHFTCDSLLYLVEIWPSCSRPDDFMTRIFYDCNLRPVFMTFETRDGYHSEYGNGHLSQKFTFSFFRSSLLKETHLFSDNSWFDNGKDPETGEMISNREIKSTCSRSGHREEDYEFDYEVAILNKIKLCYLSEGCLLGRLRLANENSPHH